MITNKLQNLKPDEAAGPDNIFPRILIECQYELLTPLYLLFKESLKSGKIPQQWKDATVVAIFKKGSKRLASNYRPISLTCIICKILESIIRDQMLEFFLQNNKISDKQFGFLPGRSCTLQLLYSGVVLPAGPVARGHPNGRRASQSHILAGPVGQP